MMLGRAILLFYCRGGLVESIKNNCFTRPPLSSGQKLRRNVPRPGLGQGPSHSPGPGLGQHQQNKKRQCFGNYPPIVSKRVFSFFGGFLGFWVRNLKAFEKIKNTEKTIFWELPPPPWSPKKCFCVFVVFDDIWGLGLETQNPGTKSNKTSFGNYPPSPESSKNSFCVFS